MASLLAMDYGGPMFVYLFHISLFIFCLNIANHRRNENALAQVIYTYGGSTLAGLIIGVTPFIFSSKMAIPTHVLARVAVFSLPAEVFRTPSVQWMIKLGTELCRCVIATTWYSHADKVYGKDNFGQSIVTATIAGSFGAVLGTMSYKPMFSVTTVSLFLAMVVYQYWFPDRSTVEEEHRARAFIVLWMMFTQHILGSLGSRISGLLPNGVVAAKVEKVE
jgi:hypothetical protein